LPLEYFDVGGGLGVDYVGARSTAYVSSLNYSMEEYAADVVYSLQQICTNENVPEPHVVSESGRALTAHHSCLVMNVFGHIEFGENGAVQAILAAQKAGKVRYVGFTGHKDPAVHLRTIEVAKKHGFRFDSLLMPLNVMDAHFRSFQHEVLPVALREGIGVTSMKSMGGGFILKSGAVKPLECLHYAMNLPTSTVIAGIDSMDILEQALDAAKTFQPMSRSQVANLLERTRTAALDGRYELFKTSNHFDATAKHPEWLG